MPSLTIVILGGANLRDVKMRPFIKTTKSQGVDRTDLSHSNLQNADLTNSVIKETNLSETHFNDAILENVTFVSSHMPSADFSNANLKRTSFKHTGLTGSNMTGANLEGSDFGLSNFAGVNLQNANLTGVIYELPFKQLPDIGGIAQAKNLEKMTYKDLPISLVELRTEFRKNGLREQERDVTYVIMRNNRQKLAQGNSFNKFESFFLYVFFELPAQYGRLPGRPLKVLFVILIGLVPFYAYAMTHCHKQGNRITASCPDEDENFYNEWGLGGAKINGFMEITVTPKFFFPRTRIFIEKFPFNSIKILEFLRATIEKEFSWFTLLSGALYISILSAFRLGWRDLNVGTWISRIQPREYTLRAHGWIKFVSGIQSVVSAYLLALSVVTYFTRPFG